MPNQARHRAIRALECPPGTEYDEETFLHLPGHRAGTRRRDSNQRLRLLLATLEPVPGKPAPIPPASAARLFEGLRLSLRDTDVMGWYRQDRVAGAVLSARADAAGVRDRRTSSSSGSAKGSGERLPSSVARSLRVRVVQQGPRRLVKR